MVDEAKWCLKELPSRAMRGAETKTRGWIGEKGCGMHRQDRVSGATAGQLPSDHTLPHSTKTLELLLSVQSVLCLALDSVIRVIKVRVLHRKAFAPPVAFFQLQREHWCRHSVPRCAVPAGHEWRARKYLAGKSDTGLSAIIAQFVFSYCSHVVMLAN